MRVYYDPEVDAAYIAFGKRGTPVTTRELDEDVNVDFDAEGRVAGIEVVAARERLHFEGPLAVEIRQPLAAEQPFS